MKRYLLSFGLILAFTFYVVLRNGGSQDIAIVAPLPSGSNSSTTATSPGTNMGSNAVPRVSQGDGEADDDAIPAPAPKPTPLPMPAPTPTPTPKPAGMYKDGNYTGPTTDAFYGPMQVVAIVQNGKLADVRILQYPNDRGTSREINGQALPQLIQEALQAQSGNVNIVSGATQSSEAFAQSLSSALTQAKA